MSQIPSHPSSSQESGSLSKNFSSAHNFEKLSNTDLPTVNKALVAGPQIPQDNAADRSIADKIFESTLGGFFEWRPRLNQFIFSPSFGAILGYVPGRLPLNIASIAAHIHSEDYSTVKLELAKALMSGQDFTIKFRMITQQASQSWFQLQLRVATHTEEGQIDSAYGSVTSIDCVIEDLDKVQAQANNEQWLRRTIRKLLQRQDDDALADCLSQFCHYIDVDHIVLRKAKNDGERYRLIASASHSRCPNTLELTGSILRKNMPFGFTDVEEGKPITIDDSDLLPSDTALFNERFKELGIRSMAVLPVFYHGSIDYYLTLIMTTQAHSWDEPTIKLAQSLGDALAQVAARRQIAQSMELSEERFQSALNASQDGIWDWDIESDQFFVTPTFLYMLGYDEEFLPLDRGKIAKLLIAPATLNDFFLEKQGSKGRIECLQQFRHADGREIPIWLRGNHVAWDKQGKATRCVGVNVDISRFYGQNSTPLSDKIEVVVKDLQQVGPKSLSSSNKTNNQSASSSQTIAEPGEKDGESEVKANTTPGQKESPSMDELFSHSKILLAEDNPINQQVATGILKRKGITVTIVNNGQEALDMLNSSPDNSFDLVLMDMEMPVLDGYQATQALRASDKFRSLPIIALTAHAREEDREKCLSRGMNDHIAKPVKPDLLYAAIARQIDQQAVCARL